MEKSKNSKGLSEKERILIKKLKSIWKDREFILGVICTLADDAEVQKMLDYIEAGEYEDPSDITVEALFIAKERG